MSGNTIPFSLWQPTDTKLVQSTKAASTQHTADLIDHV